MNQDFEIENGVLKKYHGNEETVIIPENVSIIGENAFRECESLVCVVIPEGVTCIEREAFRRCLNLENVTISNTVASIGNIAFFACFSLKSITIPGSVKTIGREAFESCKNLTEVILEEGIEIIDDFAFSCCKNLNSINIPESLKHIGNGAFMSCYSLKRIPLAIVEGKLFYKPKNLYGEPGRIQNTPDFKMLKLIKEKDYSVRIDKDVKYELIFQMYLFEFEGVSDYIKKNFSKMFSWLIENEEIEIIQKILDSGIFLTKRNIDKWIQYAIEIQKHQAQILLMNYKYQHFEFKNPADKLKL